MGYNAWVKLTILVLIILPLCVWVLLFGIVPTLIHVALLQYQVDWRKGVEVVVTANDVEPYRDMIFNSNETRLDVVVPISKKLILEARTRYPKTTNGYVIFTKQKSGLWTMRNLQARKIAQTKTKVMVAADWNYQYAFGLISVSNNNTATRRRLSMLSAYPCTRLGTQMFIDANGYAWLGDFLPPASHTEGRPCLTIETMEKRGYHVEP